MKTKHFFAVALSAVMVLFTACDKDKPSDVEIAPTKITLSQNTTSVEVGATMTLAAVISPSNATGTITWATEDESIATVSNGVITGVSVGQTTIVASIGSVADQCVVTVTASTTGNNDTSLEGSNYYLITLDPISAAKLEGKIIADFRPNEEDAFLYIWDNTYNAGTSSGPNSYGEVEPWVSLVVGTAGWSGCGFNATNVADINKLAAIMDAPEDYYLHVAIKGRTGTPQAFKMEPGRGAHVVVLGSSAFVDGDQTFQPYTSYTTDGDWNHIDIPMTEYTNNGVVFENNVSTAINVLVLLSGGTPGTTLDVDA